MQSLRVLRSFLSPRLSLISWTLIVSGLVLGYGSGSFWGLSLLILGCAVRPLSKLRLTRRPLSRERLRALSDTELDFFEALSEHLRYTRRPRLDVKDVDQVVTKPEVAGARPRAALAALVAAGLLEEARLEGAGGHLTLFYSVLPEAASAVERERERRMKSPRLGKRSRPSGLADRLMRQQSTATLSR